MITKWTTSGEVIARIIRNTNLKDDSFLEYIPEWIAEAIFKLKTHYQLQWMCKEVKICMGQGDMPCGVEALSAVTYQGYRLLASASDGPLLQTTRPGGDTSMDNPYYSILHSDCQCDYMPTETSVNNWPEYVKSSALVQECPVIPTIRYRVNYNKLEVGIGDGVVVLYYWAVPSDNNGFPMIPDVENYKTAVYWYVRSMMIGAGFPDKVFSFGYCNEMWDKYLGRAIHEITYPTPDQVQESMILSNRMVDIGTGWSTFFTAAEEGGFDY